MGSGAQSTGFKKLIFGGEAPRWFCPHPTSHLIRSKARSLGGIEKGPLKFPKLQLVDMDMGAYLSPLGCPVPLYHNGPKRADYNTNI